MATHPNIVPSFPIQKQTSPKVRTVVFGDGYQQRLMYGINQNPETYAFIKTTSQTLTNAYIKYLL